MKVVNVDIQPPSIDFNNLSEYDRKIDQYRANVAEYVKQLGYTGKLTGKVLRIAHADSYAEYLYADGGRKSCLVHLSHMDAWDSPHAHYMPKSEVLKRLR